MDLNVNLFYCCFQYRSFYVNRLPQKYVEGMQMTMKMFLDINDNFKDALKMTLASVSRGVICHPL